MKILVLVFCVFLLCFNFYSLYQWHKLMCKTNCAPVKKVKHKQLIKAVKLHFACRNNIAESEVNVKIAGKDKKGENIYRVRYLNQEKNIEGMDTYFSEMSKTIF